MKNQLIVVLAVLTIAFSSCDKDSEENVPTEALHKVVFTPEYFSSEITSLKSETKKAKYYEYALYQYFVKF